MAQPSQKRRSQRFFETDSKAIVLEDVFTKHVTAVSSQKTPLGIYPFSSELLKEERKYNSTFNAAWTQAEHRFQNLQTQYPAKMKEAVKQVPKNDMIAAISYTLDGDMFSDFNKKTREYYTSDEMYNYHSLYHLLDDLFKRREAYHKLFGVYTYSNPVYYRGCPNTFSVQEGKEYTFQCFTSTSTNREIAESFAGYGSRNTVFVISGDNTAIGLDPLSPYDEDEFLIHPKAVFRAMGISVGSDRREIHFKFTHNMSAF